MYKFSANLGLLWNEFSQIDAIYKSKEYGFIFDTNSFIAIT